MARLYVANVTRQNRIVFYRLDFNLPGVPSVSYGGRYAPPKQQTIASGRQVAIGGDLNEDALKELMRQLDLAGAVGTTDVPTLHRRQRPNFIYNIDRPVPSKIMERVYQHNRGVLSAEGHQRRVNAAMAAQEGLMSRLDDTQGTRKPDEFVVEYEQLEDAEGSQSKALGEGVVVSTRAQGEPIPPGRRRKAA